MQTVTYKYRVKDRSARKTLARHAMASCKDPDEE
jgi:hypothetical protein